MQIKLSNSNLTLLLPKGYERIGNADALYSKLYHKRECKDLQMFYNVAGESYSNVAIYHIDPKDAMSFGDKDTLIHEIHRTLGDDQGLIEVETGTNPRGYEYIYSIIKTYHSDVLNVNYCIRMNIRHESEIIEVDATYFESRMTGLRGSMGWNMAMSAGLERDVESPHRIKGWAQDPYDPNYTKGVRMILAEKRGLDGFFPSDPLSQARELVLALIEDSYYKTKEEIDKESEKRKKKEKQDSKGSKKKGIKKNEEQRDNPEEGRTDTNPNEWLQAVFGDDVERSGAYKVEIIENEDAKEDKKFSLKPLDIAKATSEATGKAARGVKKAVTKTAEEFDKVKTPMEVPDEFRNKLNRPVPKELPGWGKRKYIGFGKGTPFMSGICLSWPVTEDESLPLNDIEGLIKQYHEDLQDNQGLIDARSGLTPKGNRYAYAIRKMYFTDEDGNRSGEIEYTLNFNIRIDGQIQFINGSFQEREQVPGGRDGALELMTMGSSELKLDSEKWQRDPFDASRKKGFLMSWKEDEKYDPLFPYHPLSEMRRFIHYVIDNN